MVLYIEAKEWGEVYDKVKGMAKKYGLGRSPTIKKLKQPPLNVHGKRMQKAKNGKDWYKVVF